ncbi:hypothetical protein [Nostoc sp.]
MANVPTSLAYQQLSQYLGIHLTAFLPRFLGANVSKYHKYLCRNQYDSYV